MRTYWLSERLLGGARRRGIEIYFFFSEFEGWLDLFVFLNRYLEGRAIYK